MSPVLERALQTRGVLLDTGPLLLYLIGRTNRERIIRFKRTNKYSEQDFELLDLIVKISATMVTLPHVLTQVSDLAELDEPESLIFGELFRTWVHEARHLYPSSDDVVNHPLFARIGFADTAITLAGKGGPVVLTDDLDLYVALEEHGVEAMNFNHLRSQFLM